MLVVARFDTTFVKFTAAPDPDTIRDPVMLASPLRVPSHSADDVMFVNPEPSPKNPWEADMLPVTTRLLPNMYELAMFYFCYIDRLNAVINIFSSKLPAVTPRFNDAEVLFEAIEKDVAVTSPVAKVYESFITALPILSQDPNNVPTFLEVSDEFVSV